MRKTFKVLVLYLTKDKPRKRLRREVAAMIPQFGKVFLAAGSFAQGFPRTIHGVSHVDSPKEGTLMDRRPYTDGASLKARRSCMFLVMMFFLCPSSSPVNKYFLFPFIFSLPYSYMFYLQPRSLQVTASHF